MTDLELREVMCMFYALRQQAKQNKKITSPMCPATWETFRIICKRGKTSTVNTNYNAQLFKTVSVQIISGRGYYKAGSTIILRFGITSAQSLGKLQPELPLSPVGFGWALAVSTPSCSLLKHSLFCSPRLKGGGIQGDILAEIACPSPLQIHLFRHAV